MNIVEVAPPIFNGTPAERARRAIERFAPQVVGGIEGRYAWTAQVFADRAAREWFEASFDLLGATFPEVVTFLDGAATAYGIDVEQVAAGHYREILEDLAGVRTGRPPARDDGCTVAAGRRADGGAWVVKNRDNRPAVAGRHVVAVHRDPSWGGMTLAGTSSAGGVMASAGGINSAGFGIMSSSIDVERPSPGIARTLLQDGLLAGCATVDDALHIIGSVPHLGGTVTMADGSGAVATVELHPDAVLVERASGRPWVARTNHYCSTSVAPVGPAAPPSIDPASSAARLGAVQEALRTLETVDRSWSSIERRLAATMSSHEGPGALCQHDGQLITIATTILTTDPVTMLTSIGPPCDDRWMRWTPDPIGAPGLDIDPSSMAG